ncbi:MAG TPA: N-acetylmuramoyl-L-alanine amidase [Burkholderiales bacterium]|nr:N-acetylmuramoyl-L-alanine amidase [Burkholderiales bacterium]
MNVFRVAICASILLFVAACAPLPERAGIPTQWQPSPNFDQRRPDFVIIHHTGDDTVQQALQTLTDPARNVSAHYLIARNGTIYQLVDERARAWQAGESEWGGDTDLNSASLGIELDNNGHELFPDAQISALLALLGDIERRYHIPVANFIGHADIAPGRKVDPSRYFPWKKLAANGFGLWCDEPAPSPPPGFDATFALMALGYDVSDVPAAISAFKLHFIQNDVSSALTDHDKRILYCLLLKKAGSLQ